ncbi:MAG TPA: choice-of-anchor P family protein [Acidimicrobiales bacterium]|jgi:hypothetical protein|nr:choice-of-anchor P family protein [Acidimicrobiales bacterium]
MRARIRRVFCSSIAVGLLLAAVGVAAGTSLARAGTAIGSWRLAAGAQGFQTSAFGQAEGDVPQSQTTFETGPVGYALSAIAWPGALGANAGDLAVVLTQGKIPPGNEGTLRTLNDPVRAEARSAGPTDASYTQVPGVTMSSHVDGNGATSVASLQGADVPTSATFGNITTKTATAVDGTTASSTADSKLSHLSFAGGVVTIDSLTSNATATSNGVTGGGTATTLADGVKVAGQPATLDETGLHVGSSGTPINAAANQIAQQALSQAGFRVVVTKPAVKLSGPTAEVMSGAIVVLWSQQGNTVAFTFGAATAAADAQPGFDNAAAVGSTDTGGSVLAANGAASALPSSAAGAATPTLAGGSGTPLGVGPAGSTGRPTASLSKGDLAAADFGAGNPAWLVVVGLLAAAAVAARLRRLPDDVGVMTDEPCDGGS